MPDATLQDDELLRRMRSGDEEAFAAIYQRHQGAVYRFAIQMTGKTEIAEEITQDVFLWLMRGRYDGVRGSLAACLYGVTRNYVRRAFDRERLYEVSLDEEMDVPASGDDVLSDLTRTERIDELRAAVLSLPAQYREVVVLCELHELEYAQTAEILGCPIGTVRSRLHRARSLLLSKLRSSQRCPAC